MFGGGTFLLRAILALAMLVGYYVFLFAVALLALGVAAFALWFGGVPVIALFIPLAVAALSAWTALSVLFQKEGDGAIRGIEVSRETEPALFAFVDEVSNEMRTRPPSKIYLVADGNAFVAERGGFWGFGRHRILGIGYLFLRQLTRSELRAILGHELGHYVGGDTALGALVHRSHSVLLRSLAMLSRGRSRDAHFTISLARSFLSTALAAYTKVALRVSHAIARHQELEADRHAVRVAGKRAHSSSLTRVIHHSEAFRAFLEREVGPLHAVEAWPAELWKGYDAFEMVAREDVLKSIASERSSPYDTHPTLRDRLAFAETLPDASILEDDRSAVELLARPELVWERIEGQLMGNLPRISWDEAAAARGRNVQQLAREASAGIRHFLPGRTWTEIVRNAADCVAAEGPYRIVVAVDPEMRQVNSEAWSILAPIVFERAYGAMVAMALVEDRGGAFAHVFGSPLQISLEGKLFCPWTLAREAMGSVEGGARLRNVLTVG